MTVLVGLVADDGVAIVADRASVDPIAVLAPGVPLPGPPVVKVFASPAGGRSESKPLVAGVAGLVATAGGVSLLPAVHNIVAGGGGFFDALDGLLGACDEAAPRLREHAVLTATATPFEQPVLTVIILAGYRSQPSASGPSDAFGATAQLAAVGIPDKGPPLWLPLDRSVVFAPVAVQLDAEQMSAGDRTDTPLADQISVWGQRLGELAPLSIGRAGLDISAEFDHAALTRSGASGLVAGSVGPPGFTPERH